MSYDLYSLNNKGDHSRVKDCDGHDVFPNSESDYIRFNVTSWPMLLNLAKSYGWEPMGTLLGQLDDEDDNQEDWDGSYYSNDGQMVTAEDAANLADALERSLDDIADQAPLEPNIEVGPGDEPAPIEFGGAFEAYCIEAGITMTRPNYKLHPLEYFGGEYKKQIVDFIRFGRNGGFRIR